jgi:hypothetical protein
VAVVLSKSINNVEVRLSLAHFIATKRGFQAAPHSVLFFFSVTSILSENRCMEAIYKSDAGATAECLDCKAA